MRIDLNADVGESVGDAIVGDDAGVMASVSSVSIAAGFHGGDPVVLRRTIHMAAAQGVAVGAHPGFADREGFGRREQHLPPGEVEDLVLYQIAAVAGIASCEGLKLQHVKPHGALYNMACHDSRLARAIARAVSAFDRSLLLFGLPGSHLLEEGRTAGLQVAAEGFADRGYRRDGSLAPRTEAGAVVADPERVAARVLRMVRERMVDAVDGTSIALDVQTICVHGDTPGAAALAARARRALESAGVSVAPFR